MHVKDIFAAQAASFSFEFFPPKGAEGARQLFETIRELEPLRPSFVSVTYGAGGSTRALTHDLVVKIKTTTALEAIPHLTCIGHTEDDIRQILDRYAQAGVGTVLALAGDPPRGQARPDRSKEAFAHAADLVRFIAAYNRSGAHPDPRGFGIGVAGFPEGHPETPNRLKEMDHLKAKVDAGADYVVTQLFFENRDFYDFRDRCELAGIKVPILAGVMPIVSISGMKRMADLAGGARFPAALLRAVARAEPSNDPAAIERVGVHWATEQCRDLLDHRVRGIHFYTLNRSDATRQIYRNLGVTDSRMLAGS